MTPLVSVTLPFWLDRPAGEALAVAASADAAGLDGCWVGEMATFDAPALAGALAATTGLTLTLGPLPVALRDPAAMAMAVASVAEVGRRPARLALGSSSPVVVEQWHGRWGDRPLRRMRDAVAVLRPLLAGERSGMTTETAASNGFRLRLGVPGTAVAVAAFGAGMVDLAAEVADVVVLNQVTPAQTARVRRRIDEVAAAHRRPAPGLAVWVPAALDPSAGVEQLRRGLAVYLAPPGYGEMFAEAGFPEAVAFARSGAPVKEVAAAVPDGLVHAVAGVGVESTLTLLADHVRAGATELCVAPATAGDDGAAGLLAALASGRAGLPDLRLAAGGQAQPVEGDGGGVADVQRVDPG